jgi:rhodanese-related sulfurtransferase
MRTILLSLVLSLFLVGCKDASPAAATEPAPAEQAEVQIPEISVEDADKALQSGAFAVDANSEKTRKKNGTVPNAIILTSSYKYELSQLPDDKSKDLIFYCSNTNCTASDAAAERASTNGYERVHVMREGIKGWKDSGKATTAYPQS